MEQEIIKLYNDKSYEEILSKYLSIVKEKTLNISSKRFNKNLICYIYTIFSCGILGYYYDTIELIEKLFSSIPNKEFLKHEYLSFIMLYYIDALLFNLFNNECEDKSQAVEKIEDNFQYIENHSIIVDENQYEKQRKVFNDFINGKIGTYSVGFIYPYAPPFKDYKFDLTPKYPYISLEVKEVKRDKSISFTNFVLTQYGYMRVDPLWKGPRFEDRERFYLIKRKMPIINLLLLLTANGLTKKFIAPYNVEQVSTVQGLLLDYDGNALYQCIDATFFDAQWCGGNIQNSEVLDEELENLNRGLLQNFGCEHFVIIYQQAKNNLHAGLYVESFLLLCTVCEAMFYYWTNEIAKKHNKESQYNSFINTEVNNMKPSLYGCINYLKKEGIINQIDAKKANKLLSKVRNGNLRNDVTHGSNYEVNYSTIIETDHAILDLQYLFQKILLN